jgi:hypothetical protein
VIPNRDAVDPGAGHVDPYRRLMAAVLQTVVDDCRGTAYRRGAGYATPASLPAAQQAIAYMRNTDRAWPFSFENLCDALGMDAGSVRQQFQKDRDRSRARTAMQKHDAVARRLLLDPGVQELVDGLHDD